MNTGTTAGDNMSLEDRVWDKILELLPPADPSREKRLVYPRAVILLVVLWAAMHDRPVNWACRPWNWPLHRRPASLPDPSTVCRRRRSHDLERTVLFVMGRLADLAPDSAVAMDGRPILVGAATKDVDASSGRAVAAYGKGYKLHACINASGMIVACDIQTLSVSEKTVARELIRMLPGCVERIVADGGYDSQPLHMLAHVHGLRFYAPLRQGRVGQRHQPLRARMLRLTRVGVMTRLQHWRDRVERAFAWMSNISFGLKPIPAFVRGLPRVRQWILCKLTLYQTYRALRLKLA
jgi:hypothetical protein